MHPHACSSLFAAHKPPQPAHSTLFIHAYSSFQWLPHVPVSMVITSSLVALCYVRLPQLPSPLFYSYILVYIVTARSAHSSEHAMTPADMVIVAMYSNLCLRCLFSRHLLFIVFKPAKPTSFPACWFIAGNLSALTPCILW